MIAGRYALGRQIGRGGMGAVWLARDEVLHREVAVKRLGHGDLDLERAAREARLAAALNHPHVVAVFDLVEDDDGRWLVMEYVAGRTLAGVTAEEGALPPARAAHLLAQAAEALAAAHAGGIVHRDVKPSNMLVGPDDTLKISDFGIARADDDATITRTGMVTGSPAYLSPEVARGQRATPASDVWSLGASAFHAATGRPPYDADGNAVATLYQVVHEEPPRLPAGHPLDPLLRHTMVAEPERRWTMAQVHAFLCGREVPLAEGGTAELPIDVADPGVTQVLTAPAPPVQTSTRRRVAPPTEPPSAAAAASPEEPRPRRGPATALLVAAALLVALLGVAWGVGHLGGDPGGGAASTGADPSRASDTPTQAESSGTPSADEPTVDDMRAFVASYLTAATSDQKASWAMLTPSFQKASGGYGQYKKFWQQQQAAELVSFSADPDNLTVEYDVRYTRNGAHPVDHVRLQLAYAGGDYLIDGEG